MEGSTHILMFGDQTSDFNTTFRQILHTKDNAILTSFFEKSYAVLKEEVGNQPRDFQAQVPGFTSILDLLANYSDSTTGNTAVDSCLTCISQIAYFISYQGSITEQYPSSSNAFVLGSCTGLLAAAAVSSSRNLVELLATATEIVRLAFRVGVHVSEVRDRIEPKPIALTCWSAVFAGLQEEEASAAIDEFHKKKGTPKAQQAYISAVSPSAMTVSGPPLTLNELLEFGVFKKLKPLWLPVRGPYHAPHLYLADDVQALLRPCSKSSIFDSRVPNLPLRSTRGKMWYSAPTLKELLVDVLEDMLMRPLRWDNVLDGILSANIDSGRPQCSVLRLGPSNAGQSLVSALRQNKDVQLTLDDRFLHKDETTTFVPPTGRLSHSKIAICGLSGRFPDAAGHEEFWRLLESGMDLHRVIPKDRFNAETHVDPDGKKKNTSHTPYGCFIEDPGLFDPRFFNMSPREATQTDPMQRLALVTAYEALEMAGYSPNRTPSTKLDRVGTFYGQTSDDWREINAAQKIDTYFIPGGVRAFGPGRINYYFKFSGPSFNVDTACSSSLAAIQLACTSLWAGDCDTALAGGMNVLTNPDIFSGLSRGQFLSKTGQCQTFDNDADGYCRGDGVGTVILKRLEDAQADKDPILGVVLEAATNHSAEAVSITHPHGGAQEFLYKKVLNSAAVDPLDVSYVEMHGTGTQAGDATEMESVTNVFAPRHRQRRSDQSLHLGSVKANAGHGEAASGITSLAKVLMMMEKNIIPPHCGIKGSMNRTFPKDLKERNVHIAFDPVPWNRPEGKKRQLFLNNFSAAGGNTALIMEDPPAVAARENEDPRSTQIVTISAKAKSSLKRNIESLINFLEGNPEIDLPSLSYTTTARRMHYNYRASVAGQDVAKISSTLKSIVDGEVTQIPAEAPKIIFAFTGQGSSYAAMGKQLFDLSTRFRNEIRQYDGIAQTQGFPSIQPLVDGSVSDISSLSPTVVQLGTVCVQMALARLWTLWGVYPSAVVGHSLGEYAALCSAGVLSASETIFLVGQRAQLLEAKCHAGSHTMLAIKASLASISHLMEGKSCEVACINAPEEIVISGTNINIEMLAKEIGEQGLKCNQLQVPYAFHSAQVESILDDLEAIAAGVTFRCPSVPIISPLLSEVIKDEGTFSPEYLRRHCREPVNFLGGIEAARHTKVVTTDSIWVEVGSHPVCSGMVKATLGPRIRTSASLRRNEDDWKTIANSLCGLYSAGIDVDWTEYHRGFDSAHHLLRLPTYSWENKNYWIDYTNEWCLTKGDYGADTPVPKSKIATTTVHRIVEETFKPSNGTVTIESDLTEPDMKAAIDGHNVNGYGLCPPSLYADIALTIADYMHKQHYPDSEHADLNVCNMKVEKPLIANGQEHQLIRVTGNADFVANQINFNVYSVTSEGKKTVEHAHCAVKYENAETWKRSWERNTYFVKARVDKLIEDLHKGKNDLIKRGMAYKLFGGLITYGEKYRGMEEVILDSSELEATSRVKFQADEKDGNFFLSPYWIDSVAHLSGFIMIGNENAEPSKEVYVSHGWEDCRIARPFSAQSSYRAYVKMQLVGPKTVMGDVYVFEEDTIVAVVSGLQFHCLPRSLMDSTLKASSGKPSMPASVPSAGKQQPKPQPKQQTGSPPKSTPKSGQTQKSSPTKKADSQITLRVLAILAEEIGVPASELSDETVFAEMGVDSLLSLNISGKIREDFQIEVDSTLFSDHPTIKDLKSYLSQYEAKDENQPESVDNSSSENLIPESSNSDAIVENSSQSSLPSEEEIETPSSGNEEMIILIRSTIAGEMGVDLSEVEGSSSLADLGMDSLMSLSVLGKLREATGKDLPSDFFTENPTFDAVEESLNLKAQGKPPPKAEKKSGSGERKPEMQRPPAQDSQNGEIEEKQSNEKPMPPATSILLQGNHKTASRNLFLFPDGSGSATSYAQIPDVDADVAVFGLNSPFMKSPEDYTCGIEGLSTLYLAEIQRRQPHGPYYLGGWSAGGICAYDAALGFQKAGETVERLLLIDSPCPIDMEPLPSGLHDFFDSVGLLGTTEQTREKPGWLLPHFDSSIRNLTAYRPGRLDLEKQVPRTFVLWAQDGVCKRPNDPKPPPEMSGPRHAKWLLEDRTGDDLGPNGWETLVGGKNVHTIETVANANHFTLMREVKAREVGEFIHRALT